MTHNRMRIRCKAKRKLWRRGDACQSNPTNRLYREIANSYKSNGHLILTREGQEFATRSTDAEVYGVGGDDQSSSISTTTSSLATSWLSQISSNRCRSSVQDTVSSYQSWVSAFTQCTNSTFASLISGGIGCDLSPDNPETLALLSAASEVLKQKEMGTSNMEYAIIFSTMLTNKQFEEDQINPIIYLLSLTIQRLPSASIEELENRFNLTKILCSIVLNAPPIILVASILRCLKRLPMQDTNLSSQLIEKVVLPLTSSSKTSLRHLSRACLNSILKKQPELLLPLLEQCLKSLKTCESKFAPLESLTTLDLLRCVFARTIQTDSDHQIHFVMTNAIESLLRLCKLGGSDKHYKIACSQTIQTIVENTKHFRSNELSRWLSDILDDQESNTLNYFLISNQLLNALVFVDPKMFLYRISTHIHNATKFIQLKEIENTTLLTKLFADYETVRDPKLEKVELKAFERVISELITATNRRVLEFHESIHLLLQCLRKVLEHALPATNISHLIQKLKTLQKAALKDECQLKNAYVRLVEILVRKFDPKLLVNALASDDNDLFIVKTISKHLSPGNTDLFLNTLVPIAQNSPENERLKNNIFACLPRCILNAKDLVQNYGQIAPIILALLKDDHQVLYVRTGLSSLANLLKSQGIDQHRELVKCAFETFVPILLEMITKPSPRINPNQIIRVVADFLKFANPSTIDQYYKICVNEIENPKDQTNMSVLFVLKVLVPYLGETELAYVVKVCENAMAANANLRKRMLRIVNSILKSELASSFVQANLESIVKLVLCVDGEGPWLQAKLSCLAALIQNQPDARVMEFLKCVFDQTVTAMSDRNKRCRSAARLLYSLVVEQMCELAEASTVICGICQKLKDTIIDESQDVRARCSASQAFALTMYQRSSCFHGTDILATTLNELIQSCRPQSEKFYTNNIFAVLGRIVSAMNELELIMHLTPILGLIAACRRDENPVRASQSSWHRLLKLLVRKVGHVTIESTDVLPRTIFHKILVNIAKAAAKKQKNSRTKSPISAKPNRNTREVVINVDDDDDHDNFTMDLEDTTRVLNGLNLSADSKKSDNDDDDDDGKKFKKDRKGRFLIEDEETRVVDADSSDDDDEDFIRLKTRRRGKPRERRRNGRS